MIERARSPRRALIISADDFGAHPGINAGIELAARAGTLSAASLMVGGMAAADAVERARRLPQLRVGLHLTLLDGISTLPQSEIPLLTDARRQLRQEMVSYSVRAFADRRMQSQMRAEIRAQFDAFAKTGLELDHVDTHKHFHMHPTLLDMILEIGPGYGMKAMRVPYEPLRYVWRQSGSLSHALGNLALTPIMARMRRRLKRAQIGYCDQVFGIRWSGQMTKPRLLAILADLPAGNSEIYLHPALQSGTELSSGMRGYQNAAELDGLLSSEFAAALEQAELRPGGYANLIQ